MLQSTHVLDRKAWVKLEGSEWKQDQGCSVWVTWW